ncbi:Hypothetical predicted protein [Mytilus galloprovincialis]|uniref:VDE lipocalin domain-containing protein n=1 Tax=Mytilus galloprovincialis TaxID=29158 RepID=A0A8B6GUX8_MYTGA|nr:Hypothetical predicted protein [Mytilus galloprovincialis]
MKEPYVLILIATCIVLPLIIHTEADTCQRPNRLETSFDFTSLDGTWYVVRGLNSQFDCFDCRNITFLPLSILPQAFIAEEHYILKLNESTVNVDVKSSVSQWNASTPGIVRFYSSASDATLEWRVLDYAQNNTYVYAYYCGTYNWGYQFEGSVVLSRTTSISDETVSKLDHIATSLGWNWNSYCKPDLIDQCD